MSYNSDKEWQKIDDKYFDLIKNLTLGIGTIFGSSVALAVDKSLNLCFIFGEFFLFVSLFAGIINLYANLRAQESLHFMNTLAFIKETMHKRTGGPEDFLVDAQEDTIKDFERLYKANQTDPLIFLLKIVKIDYFYPILIVTFLAGIFFIFLSLISASIFLPFFNWFLGVITWFSALISFMNTSITSKTGNINHSFSNSFDLSTWIQLVISIGTIAAAGAAWFAIRQSNKQLKIEQTPYVVLDHIKRIGNRYGFSIKNIGRGPAISVTFSRSGKASKRNDAFFSDDQPHSANLMSPEKSDYWMVDGNVLDDLKFKDKFDYLYIFFESQSNSLFRTKIKIKKRNRSDQTVEYIVMENKFEELKGKVGV